MSLRDRFFTPRTAKAILSPWRIVLGVAVAVLLAVLGVNILLAIVAGLAVYAITVFVGMPDKPARVSIDPFGVSEPWRQHVQGALKARRRFEDSLAAAPAGPSRDRLAEIGRRINTGVEECWHIATRGDEIDKAVKRLNLPSARSDLQLLRSRLADASTAATLASLQSQIDSGERLKAKSADVAQRLRLLEVRLSELAARASEVAVGASDEVAYGNDVDDLISQLEGMRLALDETDRLSAPPVVDFGGETPERPGTVPPAAD
jgi:hypothetical protein